MRTSKPLSRVSLAIILVSSVGLLVGQTTPPSPNREGLLRIDVAVTDPSGRAVAELQPGDFTLLDNGRPTRIFTFEWPPAKEERPEQLGELILVFDEETLPPEQEGMVKALVAKYLRENAGLLTQPVFFYRISHEGIFSSSKSWLDGNLAATELEKGSEPRLIWSVGEEGLGTLLMNRKGPHIFNEIGTLGLIALDQRTNPGRKMLIWIGDALSQIAQPPLAKGFDPLTRMSDGTCGGNLAVKISTWLRESRITVNVLSPNPDSLPGATAQDFIAADQQVRARQYVTLAVSAVAAHTGGRYYTSWDSIERDLKSSANGTLAHYSLTFDPPRTETPDEYHQIALNLSDAALTAGTGAGYYNQPVYFDHPRPNLEHVTVTQLEEVVRRNPSGPNLLQRLDHMLLTERLLSGRRSQLLSLLKNDRDRQALMALADLSEFAPPPSGDTPIDPFPGHERAQAILKLAFDYLAKTTHTLPDFFATRTEVEYQEPKIREKDSCNLPYTEQPLRVSATYRGTVHYRNGAEVIEAQKKSGKRLLNVHDHALNMRGIFGLALVSILSAASDPQSSINWSRWEKRDHGNFAVFHFAIPSTVPTFEVTYCCLPEGNGTTLYRNKAAYRGEFTVDPSSGAIMRLVIEADLDEDHDPRAPLIRSQLMVEYAPLEIGGKQYISPIRSVSVSRGRTLKMTYQYGLTSLAYGRYEDFLNEYTFTSYHKFGSESCILAGYEELPESTSSQSAKTQSRGQTQLSRSPSESRNRSRSASSDKLMSPESLPARPSGDRSPHTGTRACRCPNTSF